MLRYKLAHAQSVYDDYSALRARFGVEAAPEAIENTSQPVLKTQAQPVATMGTVPEPPVQPAAAVFAVSPPPPVTASPQPRASRRWAYVGAVILGASLTSLGVAHNKWREGSTSAESRALEGTVFEATIQPATTFTIAAPAATVVQRVLVAVGDKIAAGQPLLVTDNREAIAARDAAALDVRAADARLEDLRRRLAVAGRVPAEEIARATAGLSSAERDISQVPTRQWRDSPARAEAAFEQAKTHADRLQKLFDQGLIARQELDDAQIAVRVAEDDLANARRAAAAGTVLKNAESEQSRLQQQLARSERDQQRFALEGELQSARVQRDQAAFRLKQAEERVRACTVTASSAGVVVELPAHAGDQIYAGAPLARLAVLDRMMAEVQVSPSLVNALRIGAPARVRLPGVPPVDAPGTIALVNPMPNRNGNHLVSVRFDNSAGRLLAGQIAEVRFSLQ